MAPQDNHGAYIRSIICQDSVDSRVIATLRFWVCVEVPGGARGTIGDVVASGAGIAGSVAGGPPVRLRLWRICGSTLGPRWGQGQRRVSHRMASVSLTFFGKENHFNENTSRARCATNSFLNDVQISTALVECTAWVAPPASTRRPDLQAAPALMRQMPPQPDPPLTNVDLT